MLGTPGGAGRGAGEEGPGAAADVPCRPGAYLGATVCTSQHAEADEDGVRQPHQDVIHAVHVNKLHPSAFHVL